MARATTVLVLAGLILSIILPLGFNYFYKICSTLFQAISPIPDANFDKKWSVDTDSRNLFLTPRQCHQAFPFLFLDLESKRAWHKHDDIRRYITLEDLDAIAPKKGYLRVRLHFNSVFILAHQKSDFSRDYATLQALHRAVITARYPLPNTEFVLMTDDFPTPGTPSWGYTRGLNDSEPWLMPDYGFWAWPEPMVGEYAKLQRAVREIDGSSTFSPEDEYEGGVPWVTKDDRLFWRGKAMVQIREIFSK
ncbi:hypothetical protein N0V90_010674 [Kalmusia sp. IMI 367209]|nr:hypothetical protein N0V90_010674 [Kalmusia sp. IMI 367209]